jgi:hypothetical protein
MTKKANLPPKKKTKLKGKRKFKSHRKLLPKSVFPENQRNIFVSTFPFSKLDSVKTFGLPETKCLDNRSSIRKKIKRVLGIK